MKKLSGSLSAILEKAPKAPMPTGIKPMLSYLAEEPFDKPNWIYEIKWDGYRAIAEVKGKNVSLYSRNFLNFNEKFSPVVESVAALHEDMILDGEIVLLDTQGNAHFQGLQNYSRSLESGWVLQYCIFDLLYYRGRDLRQLPLIERKKILEQVLSKAPATLHYSDHIEGQGILFFNKIVENKLEGIMAKDGQSPYASSRSRSWLKIKTHARQEVVIGGFTAPRNSRENFGALIVGVYKENKLSYVGHVGGGFDRASLKKVHDLLLPLVVGKNPFKETKIPVNAPPTWVKPKLVCEVSFQEWTEEGIMRQPIFEGMRMDKAAKDVIMENPVR